MPARNWNVFIAGETIDLVVPDEEAIEKDGWSDWFNDPELTRFNRHGRYPNTKDAQRARLQSLNRPGDNLTLMIRPKGEPQTVGVASLVAIDEANGSAEFTMFLSPKARSKGAAFHGLEAKARLTQHAFEVLGLHRIWAGQVRDRADWQKFNLLLGYWPEGIQKAAFKKGFHVHDVVLTACLVERYLDLKRARGGQFWPGSSVMFELMKKLPKENISELIADAIDDVIAGYLGDSKLT